MSVDNRIVINDCEANTGWTGDDTATVVTDAGSFYEGSSSLSTQFSDGDEHMYTTQDSVGVGTFNLDWSDSTLYMLVKDNLGEGFAAGGVQFVVGDGTNRVGYDVGGNDAIGLPLPTYFQAYKLDVAVVVASPGSFTTFAGSEASLNQGAATQIGYGANHLAKAVGSVDNAFMDCFRYIANGSYALTINGGSSGTPETMADVQGDDVTNGWGMVGNPVGEQYLFFAPTEWGESSASADHYFSASNEQWYWLGDNGGGHAIGAGNFPFRVVGNTTDTGSFVISNVVIVNTGTGVDFDCSDTNIDTLEIDGCTVIGLASFSAPASGGTSRFCTNTTFLGCGAITHNGASMNGCSILGSTVAADASAVAYNETADPDGEVDDMTFSRGASAHHALELGASSPTNVTLRGWTTSGFNASNGQNDSTIFVARTSGTVTINIVGGSGNFSYKSAGATVNVVTNPVTLTVTAADSVTGSPVQGARALVIAGTNFLGGSSVTITSTGGTATVSHSSHGFATGNVVRIRGANEEEYNGIHTITVTGVTDYTYSVSGSPASPATGAIVSALVIINAVTDSSGETSDTRSWTSDQAFVGRLKRGTTAPTYKTQPVSGTIDSEAGSSVTAVLISDA